MDTNDEVKAIRWYRSPVDPEAMKSIYRRSNLRAWMQTLGYILVLLTTGAVTFYSSRHWAIGWTLLLLFVHGTCFAFMINAVHELGHNTVFESRRLNKFFADLFAFFGWINHRIFEASHVRHHRSTLHPPEDLEVVVPIAITVKDFLKNAFVSPIGFWHALAYQLRISRGRFEGEWECKLFPESAPEKRRAAVNWSRTILVGHTCIVVAALAFKLWILVLLITLAPFYGGCLFFFCNNTQHVGLQDFSKDFRLCTRTFVPNALVRFLYWHMNYHIEHHMYVGVPCYNLRKLHELIKEDLPPSRGMVGTWIEIGAILRRQRIAADYIFVPALPAHRPADRYSAQGVPEGS